ncbi:MAG: 2-hydroxy-3-oxopropionate reductase [Terriglobia bacterium]|jgi:2-hydroxy-3-oxopropionate reductase
MTQIGFIGLGIMGKPMARNLLKAGYSLIVYDIRPGQMNELEIAGATAAESCRDAAARSEIIITMLPDGPDVESAILSKDGVLAGARQGALIIDMSSISPNVSQKVAAACALHGVAFLDAPVSGGEPKAIDGTLSIMVGGASGSFERAQPILQKMGSAVTLTGPVGAGNTTKLANQIMVACNIAAMGEALVLATRAGLDPETVFNAVKGGLASSTVLNVKAPMLIGRNFKPGFRIELHEKDLRNALEAAESLKVSLPLTSLVQQMLIALVREGKGQLDHSAIAQFVERMAGVEVKKNLAAAAYP